MFQSLRSRNAIIRIVNQEFLDQVYDFWASVRYKFRNSWAFNCRKVEFHVSRVLLEVVQQLFVGRAQDVVDFVHLVYLVIAWEQRE